jgi:hypothetical protein
MASRRSPDPPRPRTSGPAAAPRAAGVPTKSTVAAARAVVSREGRHAMIAEKAYLRAERRGFAPGRETEDWLAAEAEVDVLLRISPGGSPQ